MRRLAVIVALLGALSGAATAHAATVPEGYVYSDGWFESHDGTQMHAGVFLPADRKEGERHPVILTITPYTAPNESVTGASGGSPNTQGPAIRFPELFTDAKILSDRWAYVQIDVRSFGGSGGCFEYYGPNEFIDSRFAVEWSASQPWSTGKVGLWGKSYDAAEEVLALGSRPKGLAAAVIQAPGLSAYTALWMNRVHYATGRYATTGIYTVDDLAPPQNLSSLASAEYAIAATSGLTQAPTCRSDALIGMNTERNRDAPFWKDREPYRAAAGATTPVLWSHGFFDANTKPVHLDVFSQLKGTRQAWFGQYTHVRGHESGVGRPGFLDESMRFMDRHVRGVSVPETDPPVTVQQGNGPGRWRAEASWPPEDSENWAMPIRAGKYVDKTGNTGDGDSAGQGHWSIGAPLPHAAHLAGEVVVRAKLAPTAADVNVVAHVYDIDPDGTARLVTRGALAAGPPGEQDVTFALYPQDWLFENGHRIGVHLSGADDDWFSPGTSLSTVGVLGGSATFPLLTYFRDAFLEGEKSDGQTRAAPFLVAPETVKDGAVGGDPPPGRRTRPEPNVTVGSEAPLTIAPARRASLKLRLSGSGRKRVLRVTGKAFGVRRVRLSLRFGAVTLSSRTVRVRKNVFRATFPAGRLRSGKLTVTVRVGKQTLRSTLRLRAPRR